MKTTLLTVSAAAIAAAGAAGEWLAVPLLAPHARLLFAFGLVALAYRALTVTYHRPGTAWPHASDQLQPLHLGWLDYLKAAWCWLEAFKRTYAVEPGLYYTGERYDRDAPLLVTSNYHLTVFLIARRVRRCNARLLVIDTDGINVWCAAGKGAFCNAAIQQQLERYDRALLTDRKWLTMVLPKFGLSGIDIRALRKMADIRPIIGPLYAADLPAYLANPPLKDRDEDRVEFGLQMRAFSWLPGFRQFMAWSLVLTVVLIAAQWIWGPTVPFGLLAVAGFVATVYPFFFPWLPGERFAVKGLWLGAVTTGLLGALVLLGLAPAPSLVIGVPFAFASALFFALAYTGNSAVSNYTRVRKETAQFLPLNVLLYAVTLAAFVVTEVQT